MPFPVAETKSRLPHPFLLHHDNVPAHTSVPTLALIGESEIEMLAHPPYSPDMAPSDYFLFPRLKAMFQGYCHESVDDMQAAVKQALKDILQRILPQQLTQCLCVG